MADFSLSLQKATEQLRPLLDQMHNHEDLMQAQADRDQVFERYGRDLFAPPNLPSLTAEDFASFLEYKNNRHWSGIDQNIPLVTSDMSALREALIALVDETRPIAERYDHARRVKGLGKARITPFLLVTHPENYGVWNTKAEAGLRELEIFPSLGSRATEGEQYAAVNEVLLLLVEALEIDLWTLDTLWEVLTRRKKLAAPFDAIFADRAQAEWAFDLFADAVERLGGGPDDERFALTLRRDVSMMRLNIGSWAVVDVADRGRRVKLTLLVEPTKQAFDFRRYESFKGTFKGTEEEYALHRIPPDTAARMPEELQAIYERSLEGISHIFAGWVRSSVRPFHRQEVFEALFNEEARDRLLTHGLTSTPRYWRITLPSDMPEDMSSDGKGGYNFWADCLRHGVAAIGFDNQPDDPQIARFTSIRPGDRVVAFLRNKTIGGIGVVTSPLDEITAKERPAERDFFRGAMWRRIGVNWTAKTISVDALPQPVQNKFGRSTVVELSPDEFAEVEKLMIDPIPTIANEFRGFTPDAFAFLRELAENNNKAWMEANRERWKASVLEPMRALFADLGPHVKKLFDPYLLPDELEIAPTARKVLARINKNWSATADSKYHEYYWGAFYRAHLSRQTDAQLFVNIFPDMLRAGFYMGHEAGDAFRRRLQENSTGFLNLVAELGLESEFTFERAYPDGDREAISVKSADDLSQWMTAYNFGFVRRLSPEQAVSLGPALADRIYDAFRRVFPVYLWAVSNDYQSLVERYLSAEFPVDDVDGDEPPPTPYHRADFLRHTHLTDARADELIAMLHDKKQAIFYGPPGTGKTYVARHLARLLTGLADPPPDRLTVIQFHPAYGYEEFIEGIRPKSEKGEDGRAAIDYPVRPGAFVHFCRAATQLGDKPCIFIIDEINRGNIPRIFGELMYLLEYRDQGAPLPYSGDRFRIPSNVYLIGTMNTADRSIALVDFALRRRFHFAQFTADPDLFESWLKAHPPAVPWLGALYRRLTAEAIEDEAFRIGPSVFMRPGLDEAGLRQVWQWSIMPYLNEYYFDQRSRAELWAWDGELLRGIRGEHGG